MAEITKVYKEHFPALRFIGKRFSNGGEAWGEWFAKNLAKPLDKLAKDNGIGKDFICGLDWTGLMIGQPNVEYWAGVFFPAGTDVPEGYDFMDLEAGDVGLCWIKGKDTEDDNIYDCQKCRKAIEANGMTEFRKNSSGNNIYFHVYGPRFAKPDEDGNKTLDYGFYLA